MDLSTGARQLFKDLTTYERPVYVLIVGQFWNKFGAFVFPFFALFLQSRDYGKAEIAWVLAAIRRRRLGKQ